MLLTKSVFTPGVAVCYKTLLLLCTIPSHVEARWLLVNSVSHSKFCTKSNEVDLRSLDLTCSGDVACVSVGQERG